MNLRSYIKAFLAGLVISVMSACADSSDDISMPELSPVQSETVRMRLNVSIPESAVSRKAGDDNYQDAVTDREKISTLRIIVLDKDNKVEVNHFMRLTPTESSGYNEFEVKANQRKTLILIANEPNTDELPFSYYYEMAPLKGQFNSELYNALVKYDVRELGEKPIPMSAIYTVPLLKEMAEGVGEDDKKIITLPTLKVLRTATKFTFEITHAAMPDYNPEDEVGIRVGNISISSIADQTYLFPHVHNSTNDNGIHFLEYAYQQGNFSLIEPTTSRAPEFTAGSGVNDFSYTNFYLDNYKIPETAKHWVWSAPEALTDKYDILSGKTVYLPSFYGHESGTDKEQTYTVTMDLFDKDNNKITTLYAKTPLDNLKRLPRNTHVVVRARINPVDYSLEVKVFPYTSITLKPVFGVDYNAAAHAQDVEQLKVVKKLFQDKIKDIQTYEFPIKTYAKVYEDAEWIATVNTLTTTINAFETAITLLWDEYQEGRAKEYSPILTMDKYLTVVTDIQSLSSMAAYIVNKLKLPMPK